MDKEVMVLKEEYDKLQAEMKQLLKDRKENVITEDEFVMKGENLRTKFANLIWKLEEKQKERPTSRKQGKIDYYGA